MILSIFGFEVANRPTHPCPQIPLKHLANWNDPRKGSDSARLLHLRLGKVVHNLQHIMSAAEQNVTTQVTEAVEEGVAIPPDFICPLSMEIMDDPVIALDGNSYERVFITQWFQRGRVASPLTNQPLGSTHLVPNRNLRKG